MKRARTITFIYLFIFFTISCSVVSTKVKKDNIGPIPFETLLRQTDQYLGKTVILGGYILQTQNLSDKTILYVLQTPLQFKDEPKGRDYSKGRFALIYDGFLDPEVYRKKRKITVAGKVTGSMVKQIEKHLYTYLTIQSREIYLWQKTVGYSDLPYYRYPYYRSPYYWDPFYRDRYYW